MDNYLDKN